MKALATLSKYTGCYDRWKNIIHRYQLKWSTEYTLEALNDVMMNDEQNYTSIPTSSIYRDIICEHLGNHLLFKAP